MKIFVAHSSNYDFKNELYKPIRQSKLNDQYEFILPQENKPEPITKEIIKSCDLLLAEGSYPSTGQGIEIGWADVFGVPIVCFHLENKKISNSINKVTKKIITYKNPKDFVEKLERLLEELEDLT